MLKHAYTLRWGSYTTLTPVSFRKWDFVIDTRSECVLQGDHEYILQKKHASAFVRYSLPGGHSDD